MRHFKVVLVRTVSVEIEIAASSETQLREWIKADDLHYIQLGDIASDSIKIKSIKEV